MYLINQYDEVRWGKKFLGESRDSENVAWDGLRVTTKWRSKPDVDWMSQAEDTVERWTLGEALVQLWTETNQSSDSLYFDSIASW